MDNFYRIKKYGDCFQIRRKYYRFPFLALRRIKYSDVFQYKHAIIAERATGGYDFYLPSTKYDLALHEYTFVNRPLTLVVSNISEYLAYEDIFAFKKDCVWKFLLLHNFELELELEDDIVCSLDKRLSELPGIPVAEDMSVFFKAGFETLYNSPYDTQNHMAIFSANKDYLIRAREHEIPLYNSDIQINCLGLITKLPGGDGHYFKATYDEGESWYHNQFFDGITYGSIEPMKEDEYPSIYPAKDFYGYWKKNHDGFILGLAFLSNVDSASLELHLPYLAKKVQFVKTVNRVNLHDGTDMLLPATLWKITSTDDEELFLLISGNNYVTMSLEDFTK